MKLALGACLVGAVAIPVIAHASTTKPKSDYLALGDSITYGFREANTLPNPAHLAPASFTGFPEDVGGALDLNVANAACRGETSGQLIGTGVAALACPLHVGYSGTQLHYAKAYLQGHPDTKLVTLMIGINDVLNCQQDTSDNCARQLPRVLVDLSRNVGTTLKEIRTYYKGTIVVVNYYPLVYLGADHALAVNATVDRAASRYHVRVANGWRAFETAAADASGNVCKAGLLTQLVGGGCGIHPSLAGQAILALAVEEAINGYVPPSGSTPLPPPCTRFSPPGPEDPCSTG